MGAYMVWRKALKDEARNWLSANRLDPACAEYLSNFIERGMAAWCAEREAALSRQDAERAERPGQGE